MGNWQWFSDNSIMKNGVQARGFRAAEVKKSMQSEKIQNGGYMTEKESAAYCLEELIRLCDSRCYQTAVEYYKNHSFQDVETAEKYRKYAEAMLFYNKKMYGMAYKLLSENCIDLEGSREVLDGIESAVGDMDGVYVNTGAGYYGMFCVIDHGMVCLHTTMTGMLQDAMYYNHTLAEGRYNYGGESLCISDITGTITYFVLNRSGDSFYLDARDGYEYQTFNGYYVKTAERIPKQK
ncbi:MAG: hypothetical protein Q4B22_01060 [Eubacteriales bacterium]|nr:hypothetical protein [Eubacteriales bacterium]